MTVGLGSMVVLLRSEVCVSHELSDRTLEQLGENAAQHVSGCRKLDIAWRSVVRSLSLSQISLGVVSGCLGRRESVDCIIRIQEVIKILILNEKQNI